MTARNLTILLLSFAAALPVGCGADDETKPSIPPATARSLDARLLIAAARERDGQDGETRRQRCKRSSKPAHHWPW